MSNTEIREKLSGFKLPKSIRKSSLFTNMLATRAGREILAKALIAGAHAAAAALLDEDAQPNKKGAAAPRRKTLASGFADRAMQSAADAATQTMTEPARALYRARNDGPIFGQTSH